MNKNLEQKYMTLLRGNLEEIKEGKLTFTSYKEGSRFHESKYKLMYVGRAINGWFALEGCNEDEIYSNALKRIRETPIRKFGGTLNRSAFWQLCKLILNEKEEVSEDWDEKIVWSNLFKVAPVKGGNPNYKLIKKTVESCIEILKEEIKVVKPQHIVMVTGEWWITLKELELEKTFATEFNIKIDDDGSFVIGKGNYNGIPIVVTQRPERRSGTRKEQANEVIKTLDS